MKWVIGVKTEISEILPTLEGLWATNDGNQNIQGKYHVCGFTPSVAAIQDIPG